MLRTLAFLFAFAASALAQNKVIYLTFDDGPQGGTSDVLDVLKEEQIHATFFLTGSNALTAGGVEAQKDLVLRELAEGHDIANHCYIHKPMTKADYRATYGELETEAQREAFRVNLQRNEDYFRKTLNRPDLKLTLARLPGDGSTFPRFVSEIQGMGMKHFAWQNEFAPNGVFKWLKNSDWHGATGVSADYPDYPADGAVILFHDRHWAGDKKVLLKGLIELLKEKGYTFGKLSERQEAAAAK